MVLCLPFRNAWNRALNRCFDSLPCLSDPDRRSVWILKLILVGIHVVFIGVLFIVDNDLIEKARKEPWYIATYFFLFVATLAQYFFTSSSSPGYVIDAMRVANETHVIFTKAPTASKQYASGINGSLPNSIEGNQSGRNSLGTDVVDTWTKLVMDMYPPESSNSVCTYCDVLQPPRSKHCHDCDKCVLQFDHHCVWLGACIGQGNHCRFWWYVFEETALCIWTCMLYISYLRDNFERAWWKDGIMIFFLALLSVVLIFQVLLLVFHCYLILTNQTTYELVRRRRIPYLRGIPEMVFPFSKGMCRNVYNFCCSRSGGIYKIEPLPSAEELEAKSRPYTCWDALTCRCC